MPYRGDVFRKGHYYHLYNRGAGRNLLFFNPDNHEYCLHLIKRYHQRYGATLIAYCLMPNHYHFLLRQESDEPLSRFIGVLFNGYVQAKLVTRPEDWPYSNYPEYIGQRAGILKVEAFIRDRFSKPGSYQSFVADYGDEERVRRQIENYVWD